MASDSSTRSTLIFSFFQPKQIQPPPRKSQPTPDSNPEKTKKTIAPAQPQEEEDDLDFFAKQAKLQAEATMALAQVSVEGNITVSP